LKINISEDIKHTQSKKNKNTEDKTFEEKFKKWVRDSNEKQASINKRNKKRI